MSAITVNDLWHIIYKDGHKFFSVEFARRQARRGDPSAPAGSIRKMVCRTGITRFKNDEEPSEDRMQNDKNNGIITVWSLDVFKEQRSRGFNVETAGSMAWRRIPVDSIKQCSLVKDVELPPEFSSVNGELDEYFKS